MPKIKSELPPSVDMVRELTGELVNWLLFAKPEPINGMTSKKKLYDALENLCTTLRVEKILGKSLRSTPPTPEEVLAKWLMECLDFMDEAVKAAEELDLEIRLSQCCTSSVRR